MMKTSNLLIKDKSILLNLKDFCSYLGIGQTKARELLKSPDCNYCVRIGNRLYAHKQLLDEYLMECAKYKVAM